MPLSVGSHRHKNKDYSAIGSMAEGTAVHTQTKAEETGWTWQSCGMQKG